MIETHKYAVRQEIIPQSQRADINKKILHLVSNGLVGQSAITAEDVYNCYTGDGGLHGLRQSDFANYHEYADAKKEIEQGQFFTPPETCRYVIDCLRPGVRDIVYDLTCGMGSFFNFLPVEENVYGADIDLKALKVAKYLFPKAHLSHEDIRGFERVVPADYVIGNPPFNLDWNYGNEVLSSQMFYCVKAAQVLRPGGILAVIMPQSFLGDEFFSHQIERMDEQFDFLVQVALPDNAFGRLGVSSFSTKLMVFQRKSKYLPARAYHTGIEGETPAAQVFEKWLSPVNRQRQQLRSKFLLEKSGEDEPDKDFTDKVTKLLFDIKCNRKTAVHLGRCEGLVNKYLTQKRPDDVSYEEWAKIRIGPQDVLTELKQTLASANRVYRDEKRIIKTDSAFYSRDYSRGGGDSFIDSINDMVLDESGTVFGYDRLLAQKRKEYSWQSQVFSDMVADTHIAEFLEKWSVYSELEERQITLNAIQKNDINKMLQKRYGILQYEMGSGKTVCSLAMAAYLLTFTSIRNVFVVADALAANNTWEVCMEDYKIPFYRVNNRTDAANIPRGCIVLVTLGMVDKLRRELRRHVKACSQKVALIFDESDSITNPFSSRTKAMLTVFRRCRVKYLTTGTTTRNNICEIAPEMELLYNNSINYISWAEHVYEKDKEGEEHLVYNELCGRPFPAWRQGYKLFSKSHLPHNITVFGVEQFTQDVYNAEVLNELLAKTIITRSFEEVAGRKIYDISQVMVPMHQAERDVYTKAVVDFHEMRWNYFSRIGNTRKDSMFRILQQLILLLKICADPAAMKEYDSSLESSKVVMMLEMVGSWKNERVAIGVRHVDVAKAYAGYINKMYPGRPVFLITGGSASFKRRRQVVKELEKTTNGILLCTQQAYAKSQNIDFVDKIILPELHFNNAAMSQFYFRFIRYTSINFKKVYFLTYEYSIESNLIRMIMAKEKLNLFMKNQDVDDDELFERFGADKRVIDMLMTIGQDKDGKVEIRWGQQKIAS